MTSTENKITRCIACHRTVIEIREHEISLEITVFSALPYPHVQSGVRREPYVALAVFRNGTQVLDILDRVMTDTPYHNFFLR